MGVVEHGLAELVPGGRLLQDGSEIDHRDGGRRHPEGHAPKLALKLGDDQTDRLGGSGGRGYDVLPGRASIPHILGRQILQPLGVSVGVHGGQESFLDAKTVIEDLGYRSQAVGGAGGVGDHPMFLRVVSVSVDPEHDGDVLVLGRGGDDHLPGAARFDVSLGLVGVGEDPGGFDHHLHPQIGPADGCRVSLGQNPDSAAIHHQRTVFDPYRALKGPIGGIVLQQMSIGFGGKQIIDGRHLDGIRVPLQYCPQDLSSNSAKPVDADLFPHFCSLLKKYSNRLATASPF